MIQHSVIISVIVPIYNDELYLKDALLSIQQQSFTDFECICVNDGSTDKSEEIIDEFVALDERFIKINKTNSGVSATRNVGLCASKGEYIFFMDHDDLTPGYSLQVLFDAIQQTNSDLARGRMMMIPENFILSDLPNRKDKNSRSRLYNNPLTDFYRHIRGKNKNWYYIWMCLYKKSAIKDIRFLEELRSGGEDNLFIFEMVANIRNFVQISDIVACHRYSKISVTLNGYKPTLYFNIVRVLVPHVYKKYALDENIDKRLLWWVYRKVSYAVYRYLIRDVIRKNKDNMYLKQARQILLELENTQEFYEITKRWNFRQKIIYRLFLDSRYVVLRKLRGVL